MSGTIARPFNPDFDGDYFDYGEVVLAEAREARADTSARGRLFDNHDKLCSSAKELMVAKNKDYASDQDPFRNFRMFGSLGILVRMSDKLARLRNYVENGSYAVKDEGVWDTARDMVNYTNILLSYLEEEKAGR